MSPDHELRVTQTGGAGGRVVCLDFGLEGDVMPANDSAIRRSDSYRLAALP